VSFLRRCIILCSCCLEGGTLDTSRYLLLHTTTAPRLAPATLHTAPPNLPSWAPSVPPPPTFDNPHPPQTSSRSAHSCNRPIWPTSRRSRTNGATLKTGMASVSAGTRSPARAWYDRQYRREGRNVLMRSTGSFPPSRPHWCTLHASQGEDGHSAAPV